MARLSASDHDGILGLLHAVADAAGPDEFCAAALGGVAALVPSDAITLKEVDPLADRVAYLAVTAFVHDMLDR